jgi:dTMP kinase
MFITFEGLDYSGKTTQASLLVERLKKLGHDVVFLREPGGTALSEKIRLILLDRKHIEITQKTELFLFSAARSQLVNDVIAPSLRAGKTVVCDRYADSTTAYQGYGRGLDLDEVKTINRIATAGTRPTVTVLVDVDASEIRRRRQARGMSVDRMESSGDDFYKKVHEGYRALAREEPGRFVVVRGNGAVGEIHEEIWNIIQQRLT